MTAESTNVGWLVALVAATCIAMATGPTEPRLTDPPPPETWSELPQPYPAALWMYVAPCRISWL